MSFMMQAGQNIFGKTISTIQAIKEGTRTSTSRAKSWFSGLKVGDIVKVESLSERNKKELEHINFKEKEFPFEPESYV